MQPRALLRRRSCRLRWQPPPQPSRRSTVSLPLKAPLARAPSCFSSVFRSPASPPRCTFTAGTGAHPRRELECSVPCTPSLASLPASPPATAARIGWVSAEQMKTGLNQLKASIEANLDKLKVELVEKIEVLKDKMTEVAKEVGILAEEVSEVKGDVKKVAEGVEGTKKRMSAVEYSSKKALAPHHSSTCPPPPPKRCAARPKRQPARSAPPPGCRRSRAARARRRRLAAARERVPRDDRAAERLPAAPLVRPSHRPPPPVWRPGAGPPSPGGQGQLRGLEALGREAAAGGASLVRGGRRGDEGAAAAGVPSWGGGETHRETERQREKEAARGRQRPAGLAAP